MSFPAVTDTTIYAAQVVRSDAALKLNRAATAVRHNVGHVRNSRGEWTGTLEDALTLVDFKGWRYAEQVAAYHAVLPVYVAAAAAVAELEVLYTGWSRFFLVQNTNGHIHSTMSCSTCFADTDFAWLPELSGLTETDAVEAYGEILCSVCFPSAPVAWTNGVAKVTLAAKAERAAAKAERDATKLAKALMPDGSDFGVEAYVSKNNGKTYYGTYLKTLVAARNWLINEYRNERYYGGGAALKGGDVARVIEAIANKTGKSAAEVEAAARKTSLKG